MSKIQTPTDDCTYRGRKTRWYFPDLLRRGIWMRKRKKQKQTHSHECLRRSKAGWSVLVFYSISYLRRGSPECPTITNDLTEYAFQRPPTTGRVRAIVWWRGFYAGRGQAIRTGHGHLPLQKLVREKELKKCKPEAQQQQQKKHHMIKANMKTHEVP